MQGTLGPSCTRSQGVAVFRLGASALRLSRFIALYDVATSPMEHATLKHDFVVLDKVRFAVTRLCQQIMQGEFQGVTRDLLVEPEVLDAVHELVEQHVDLFGL